MEQDSAKSFHERLIVLEAICAEQNAQIDGLVEVVVDLLAAHVVLHKDLRLCTFLGEKLKSDITKEREGGTSHMPASYFGARADLWAGVLKGASNSQVFDHYWFHSLFRRKEERQRAWLEKTRSAILKKLKFD